MMPLGSRANHYLVSLWLEKPLPQSDEVTVRSWQRPGVTLTSGQLSVAEMSQRHIDTHTRTHAGTDTQPVKYICTFYYLFFHAYFILLITLLLYTFSFLFIMSFKILIFLHSFHFSYYLPFFIYLIC